MAFLLLLASLRGTQLPDSLHLLALKIQPSPYYATVSENTGSMTPGRHRLITYVLPLREYLQTLQTLQVLLQTFTRKLTFASDKESGVGFPSQCICLQNSGISKNHFLEHSLIQYTLTKQFLYTIWSEDNSRLTSLKYMYSDHKQT